MKIKRCELKDVATWERAKAGKIYPVGCSTLQISATKGQIGYLDQPQEVEPKDVVIKPNQDIQPYYFYVILKKNIGTFLSAYKQGLNIREQDVGHYPLELHDYDKQMEIAKIVKGIDTAIVHADKSLNVAKDLKQNMLRNMFC